MDLAQPKLQSKRSSFYRLIRKSIRGLGVERFFDEVIARLNNEDRMVRLHKEGLYQEIFREFCRIHEIKQMFYPVGGGANYSLLYLLSRICSENQVSSVLELGAGQSTLLLSELSERFRFSVTSIEHSEFWAKEVQSRVGTTVLLDSLVDYPIEGQVVPAYSLEPLSGQEGFDFVLVDGPNSSPQFSRGGVRKVVEEYLNPECIMLFDDAERPGERQTISMCRRLLENRGSEVFERSVSGTSTQVLLCTKRYEKLRFY